MLTFYCLVGLSFRLCKQVNRQRLPDDFPKNVGRKDRLYYPISCKVDNAFVRSSLNFLFLNRTKKVSGLSRGGCNRGELLGERETENEYEKNELLRELIDDYAERIKRLAYTYVKNWAVADDITQDVFISCFKNIVHFRGDSSYKTWLFKITVNRCKDYLKSKWFRSMIPLRGMRS